LEASTAYWKKGWGEASNDFKTRTVMAGYGILQSRLFFALFFGIVKAS
jgi:hypothetical protein